MWETDRDTFRRIFVEHWSQFKVYSPSFVGQYYDEVVAKMLGCGKEEGGYSQYVCMNCGKELRRVAFTCKGCFCLSFSKACTDEFVAQVSRVLGPELVIGNRPEPYDISPERAVQARDSSLLMVGGKSHESIFLKRCMAGMDALPGALFGGGANANRQDLAMVVYDFI